MLVTDGGKLIRCPLDEVSIKGRGSQGVSVFNVEEEEKVVSVARLRDMGEEEEGDTDVDGASDGNVNRVNGDADDSNKVDN